MVLEVWPWRVWEGSTWEAWEEVPQKVKEEGTQEMREEVIQEVWEEETREALECGLRHVRLMVGYEQAQEVHGRTREVHETESC